MENVVAKTEFFNGQAKMGNDVTQLVQVANELQVNNEADRTVAAQWLKAIKTLKDQAKEAWGPFEKDAKAILDRIRKQKKEMIDPLDMADKTIRAKVVASIDREREEKRKEAERLKELARKEVEASLAAAAEASASGDDLRAEMSLMDAEVYEQAANTVVADKVSKTKGVATIKEWEIVSIDSNKVPIFFMGTELRPVKEGSVKALIQASKGTIEIPGVVYQETTRLRVL